MRAGACRAGAPGLLLRRLLLPARGAAAGAGAGPARRPGAALVPVVAALPETVPFVPPEAIERALGRRFAARLGANELTALGPSPAALEAMGEAVRGRCNLYGDPASTDLRAELGRRLGRPVGDLCVGGGIDDLLCTLVRMYVGPGDGVVTSLGAYPTFNYHVAAVGGEIATVPFAADFREDLEGLLARAWEVRPKLVYVANPDNPMGTCHPAADVGAFLEALPGDTTFLYDEAYHEFAPPEAVLPLEVRDPRLIRLRTFSKAYGLAGARIGYCVADGVAAKADRIRQHFGLNVVAQAGALAALRDDAHLSKVVREVAAGREEYYRVAAAHGLPCVESATNFVAIDVGSAARSAGAVEALARLGVFVRRPTAPGLDTHIRVSVGSAAEREAFAEALPRALAGL